MTRTLPNRVVAHTPPMAPVAYPDAIAGAVAFLHAQLRNPDTAVGMAAAMALLDLEKTRMRHGQPVPHIAAGLPAGVAPTANEAVIEQPQIAVGSSADLLDAGRPAGKPAAMCGQIATASPGEPPATDGMTVTEMLADPEMLAVIRQARCEMERATPGAVLTNESVGRMLHEQMRELRRCDERTPLGGPAVPNSSGTAPRRCATIGVLNPAD